MAVFLDEPDYVFGCPGFITTSPVRRFVIRVAAALSVIVAATLLVISVMHGRPPDLTGQALGLVALSWIGVGVIRLFFSGIMRLFGKIVFDWLTDAATGLSKPVHYLRLGCWIFMEASLSLGLILNQILALLMLLGLAPPMSAG